jgi:type II secretory pathway component PulF
MSLKLKISVFAKLSRTVASHFIRTFATITEAGIPLIDALAAANKMASNHGCHRV